MKKGFLIILITSFGLLACDDNDDGKNNCDLETVISSEQYANAPADPLTIVSVEINEDCLKIKFGASGCSGDFWELKLIDSEQIMESNPPQRNLRLSLKNNEDCLAYFTKEISFDISQLKVDGNKVFLNITNSGNQILYEY